ncbi:hypothetical protein [Bradyrhizobium sp. LTSP857]|uniref:hypothetical protein n=1 Tax=Bradyrhizobium sp. LTSP857 TaxID=1619231 RepID=UPI0005DBD1C8|nr:hypothetical protein [Bradyrhizobium sp. LTSP857]KJC34761.1 hypothetical protein UP06_35400 [Bradyrhizobium sp. LTSP857]
MAIWDIDVHSGFVNRVLDAINQKQKLFKFTRIEATVPMGLTMSGQRTREIVRKLYGSDLDDPTIERSVWAQDIYRAARPILKAIETDLLVCLVAPSLMDQVGPPRFKEEGFAWEILALSNKRVALISAFNLRNYAKKASRSFEACLAALIFSQVLVECFGLEEHDPGHGCIMDLVTKPDDLIQLLRRMEICQDSIASLPSHAREGAAKIVETIREYTP